MDIKKHNYNWKGTLSKRTKTTRIFLHCSATPEGKDYTVEQINEWHKQNGWSGIGYHFVIYRDGSIHEGRPIGTMGAHATGYNASSVSVCYIGGMDSANKVAKDTRTEAQKRSMCEIVRYIMKYYNIKLDNVVGHYQFTSGKACPSFKIDKFKGEYKAHFGL